MLQDQKGKKDKLEQQDLRVLKVTKDHKVTLDLKVKKVKQVQLDLKDLKVMLEHKDQKDKKDK